MYFSFFENVLFVFRIIGCQDDFFGLVSSFFKLPHNGWQIGDGADF